MTAPDFIPPGVQPPMGLHVEILRYRGILSQWTKDRREILRVRLVSAAGERHRVGVWAGREFRHAQAEAAHWSVFLGGVPIVHRTGAEQVDGGDPPYDALTIEPRPGRWGDGECPK